MTTFLTMGPGTGVSDLWALGVPELWSDGVHEPFRAVQCGRYVEVETVNGCISAGVGDFVREVLGGLLVVRWRDWQYERAGDAYAPGPVHDSALPIPEPEAPPPPPPPPRRRFVPPYVEIPARWRLERMKLEPLRTLCRKAHLPHSGRRPDLINRLREYAAETTAG